jgi:aspartate dehydrogenase
MLVMSTGGLLEHQALLRRALGKGIPIYLPSGALAGLDGIKGGAIGRWRSITLTTRKPPQAFVGAPGLMGRKILPGRLRRPRLLFQGSPYEASSAFPQNINVAATLMLAARGTRRTRVRIMMDPSIRQNIHEIEAVGSFGRIFTRTENWPSPENPKTSQLAVLSAVATLREILQPLRVGT